VADRAQLIAARARAAQVHVSDSLLAYVLALVHASREHPRIALGLSTRGALALVRTARVVAGLRGSDFVAADDVKEVARWVMPHRLSLSAQAIVEGDSDTSLVDSLLGTTPVPR